MRLLRSHALETGTPITPEEVRGMIAVRANQLSSPGSGVPAELLERLVSLLENDELPTIYSQSAIGTGYGAGIGSMLLRECSRWRFEAGPGRPSIRALPC